MEVLLGSLAGILMAASVWLMLSRNLIKFLLGLVLIGNVANLVIFVSGKVTYGAPPLIAEDSLAPAAPVANAVPQALILTAIVIGFGLVAFTLVLALRAYQELGTVNVDAMNVAERPMKDPARNPRESAVPGGGE